METLNDNTTTNNVGSDDIFAQLIQLFGESFSTDFILNVCTKYDWKCKFFVIIKKKKKTVENKIPSIIVININIGLLIIAVMYYFICLFCFFLVSDCIDALVHRTCDDTQLSQSNDLAANNDLDIVIESEEIQTSQFTSDLSADTKPFFPSTATGAIPKTNSSNPPHFLISSDLKHNNNNFNDRSQSQRYKQDKLSTSIMQTDEMDDINNAINRGHKILIIMRGPPGCGKTYLSRQIIDRTMIGDYSNHIFSTDDYFLDIKNRYIYDRTKITDAHEYNKERVRYRAENGWSPVIVDNTMNKVWELYPYVEIAVRYGYVVKIIEVRTPWSKSAGRLAGKNRHNVPKEKIERMLQTYESTTIDNVMRSLNLRYQCMMPQIRCYPKISDDKQDGSTIDSNEKKCESLASKLMIEPVWSHNWTQSSKKSNNYNLQEKQYIEQPKPARSSISEEISNCTDGTKNNPFEIAVKQLDKISNEWTAYEKERVEFWNKNYVHTDVNAEKNSNKIDIDNNNHSKISSILKSHSNETDISSTDISTITCPLEKHSINCVNENSAFAQIRQIYPAISLNILWDLFKNCNGDPDWAMDILLKDGTHVEAYNNFQDNFQCTCNDFVNSYPNSNIKPEPVHVSAVSLQHRSKKEKRSENVGIKKQIEENFILADQHYSPHARKIRDIRRGIPPPGHTIIVDGPGDEIGDESGSSPIFVENIPNNEDVVLGASATVAPNCDEAVSQAPFTDEFIEIDLGKELVRQLDNAFGIDVFKQNDNYGNLKTTVFMPHELAQQLYALWMESLFNQVEEQRQQSIRDDENFARQLNSAQSYPELKHQSHVTKKGLTAAGLKDIIDMEFAWTAYKTKIDEWNRVSPKDLAARMTHDKLAELFPDANRDSLIQVLAAHQNNFSETVNVLKETLRTNVADRVEKSERVLFERAKSEVELVSI